MASSVTVADTHAHTHTHTDADADARTGSREHDDVSAPPPSPRLTTEQLAAVLINKLSVVPHHAISLRRSKYRVIRRMARYLGWDIVRDKEASIVWLDKWETADMTNLRYFKVGHFQAMREVSSKCSLARTLNRMRVDFPTDYDFHPVSFTLPNERDKLTAFAAAYHASASRVKPGSIECAHDRTAGTRKAAAAVGGAAAAPPELAPPAAGCWYSAGTQPQPAARIGERLAFIVKPDTSSRGNGIYLALSLDDIHEYNEPANDSGDDAPARPTPRPTAAAASDDSGTDGPEPPRLTLVQAYLPRPILMDGRKFDLRIYVLVTSAYPTLRVYIYRQGLVRLASEAYAPPTEDNVASRKMFLTNYAVNKPAGAPGGKGDDAPDDDSVASDVPDGSDDDDREARPKKKRAAGRDPGMPPRGVQHSLVRARDGCKWSLDAMLECLASQGVDTVALWARIKDIITKTMLAIRPQLAQRYRAARPHLRKVAAPPPPPQPKRRAAPRGMRTAARASTEPAASLAALSPRADARAREPPDGLARSEAAMPSTSSTSASEGDALSDAVLAFNRRGFGGIPSLAAPQPGTMRRALSATSPRERVMLEQDQQSGSGRLGELGLRGLPVASAIATGRRGGSGVRGASSLMTVGAAVLASSGDGGGDSLGFGLVGTSVSLSAARPARKLDIATQKMPVAPRPPRSVLPSATAALPSTQPGAAMVQSSIAALDATSMTMATRAPKLPSPSMEASAHASIASSSKSDMASADGPRQRIPRPKKPAETAPAEEEDGEQGFRCYELMGLDVILDMSHCTCSHSAEYQRFTSRPEAPRPAGVHRCQPRPVLLEINQSCSLHSDSDLDKVLKGDVVLDAFSMCAPDETWLTERFKEVLELKGREDDPRSTPCATNAPNEPEEYDPSADAARLSSMPLNELRDRASFDGISDSHTQYEMLQASARAEALALMRAFEEIRLPSRVRPGISTGVVPVVGQVGAERNPTAADATPMGSFDSKDEDHPIPNLGLVPWVPTPPTALTRQLDFVGSEELWFGTNRDATNGSEPSELERRKLQTLYALGCVPPLSARAQLVLVLRRVYEKLHRGGFQPLLPPPSPELVARYKAIAEHVPLSMRETTAFTRRRQEALALRAALETKLPGSRW